MKWYVLHVMTGEETTIKEKLLLDLPGINALAPRQKVIERHKGTFREVVRILFPSYVFVQMDLDEKNYYAARRIAGVINFLAHHRPIPVPDDQMANVLWLCKDDELVGLSTLEIGESIKVINGPLTGMEGYIVKIDKRKRRAKVRLTLFQKEMEVNLGIEFIQAS
ncbi:transcriptional antiterminator NusG [Desulfotomaculum arcticum]|uniref:Transcription termination/antitermination protein NusG n=1 Tax=Desulfotruncus arcticus DSM 17038 TaxID=1121424 RepID=A0A1I2Y6V4_9FIRM|nr:antiterminator LoaP [Desulfotruncus arcticus]SFH21498.1 transcriptional antiterminator NusG [Desulfotomaculum arcticum] [Desulfotruncus arcticus DSM 17038]